MAEPITDDQLAELRRLEGEATPPPWVQYDGDQYSGIVRGDGQDRPPHNLIALMQFAEGQGYYGRSPAEQEANSRFVTAARNALPGLLARLERLEAALRRRHQCPDCGGFGYNRVHGTLVGDRCACQDVADAALAAAEPAG